MTDNQTRHIDCRSGLIVYLFNVGQGDHVLLRLPTGEYGIIDFYYDASLPAPPALGYLQEIRRRTDPSLPIKIAFICLSHPDYDHVKGLEPFLEWIDDEANNVQLKDLWIWPGNILEELIKQYEDFGRSVIETDSTSRATDVSKQLKALFKFRDRRSRGRRRVKVQYLRAVEKLAESAGGVKVVALAPLGEHVKKFDRQAQRDFVRIIGSRENSGTEGTAQQNLLSSILMLIYKAKCEHRLLFGGDAGTDVWNDCLRHYAETGQDTDHGSVKGMFVKASHHGSRHSSSASLWSDLLQEGGHVAISAGNKKQYRHPHPETLRHILDTFKEPVPCAKIWSTNTCEECVSAYLLPVQRIDWIRSQRPVLDPLIENSLKHYRWDRSGRRTKKTDTTYPKTDVNLAAYIFHFDGESESVDVQKGVSPYARTIETCLYKNEDSLPFPMCAIRRLHEEQSC